MSEGTIENRTKVILAELQSISGEMKEVKALLTARRCIDCGRPIIGENESLYCPECS